MRASVISDPAKQSVSVRVRTEACLSRSKCRWVNLGPFANLIAPSHGLNALLRLPPASLVYWDRAANVVVACSAETVLCISALNAVLGAVRDTTSGSAPVILTFGTVQAIARVRPDKSSS
jgi:hypothetical protein